MHAIARSPRWCSTTRPSKWLYPFLGPEVTGPCGLSSNLSSAYPNMRYLVRLIVCPIWLWLRTVAALVIVHIRLYNVDILTTDRLIDQNADSANAFSAW